MTKFLGGGMSHVYMARDTLIGRTVAVKILTDSGATDETTKARFIREAQLAGNVIHDNIIRVYDFGEESGRLFMVMEFLQGEDLNDAIKNGHAGSLANRIAIAVQIARAMEHVHSLDIVHRDLKPHNVYITTAGVAKLMDFGIAKTEQTSMTKTGFTVGTPNYMPPEQVLGKQVNRLSDIYAFGILLFELITEIRPYTADTIDRLFYQVLNEPVDLEPLRAAGAPEPLVDLIHRCTQKDPAGRPQSFKAVREHLEALERSGVAGNAAAHPPLTPGTAIPAPASPARQPDIARAQPAAGGKKWLIAAIAFAALLVVVLAVFVFRPRKTAPSVTGTETSKTPVAAALAPVLSLPSGDMVLITPGTFLFGEKKEPRDTPAYYIDRAEVTRAAYKAFLDATGYAAPPGFASAQPDSPVSNVTIKDAREFARWARKRLPTSVEWEKAARGTDGRLYPWGDSTVIPAGDDSSKSPYGAARMVHNLWELVDQPITPSPGALRNYATLLTPKPTASEPWCMIRGGSHEEGLLPVYEFASIPERFRKEDIGFRCVRDAR